MSIHVLYSSKRLAYFLISISTVFWFIFYIHVLIKVEIEQIYPTVFVCSYATSGLYFEFNYYSNLVINIILSVILIILSTLSFKKVRRIRIVPRQQRQQLRTMNKKDFQLLRCLYVYDIVYIIFIAFPSIYGVYLAITKDQTFTPLAQAIINFIQNVCTFLHHIPYCASFFIFISVSKAFRQEIKRLMWKMVGKDQARIQEEENREQNDGRDNIELNVVS